MRILIACECSGKVRDEFIKLGYDAISCDILPTENPGPHYEGDLNDIINDGWDLMIGFPPCTHLAVSGACWFPEKQKDGRQQSAIDFFMLIANASIPHIAIENPIGIMSNIWRKPDQIIHPYYFGDPVRKSTCLWLKNLPKLFHNKENDLFYESQYTVPDIVQYGNKTYSGPAGKWYRTKEERSRERSRTYDGIAYAMASQWSEYLNNQYQSKNQPQWNKK